MGCPVDLLSGFASKHGTSRWRLKSLCLTTTTDTSQSLWLRVRVWIRARLWLIFCVIYRDTQGIRFYILYFCIVSSHSWKANMLSGFFLIRKSFLCWVLVKKNFVNVSLKKKLNVHCTYSCTVNSLHYCTYTTVSLFPRSLNFWVSINRLLILINLLAVHCCLLLIDKARAKDKTYIWENNLR